MKSIFNYSNVFLDSKSEYTIYEVNERNYLEKLFRLLETVLSTNFKKHQFFVLFSHNPMVIPASSTIEHSHKVLFWFSEESGKMPSHLRCQYKVIFKSYIQSESGNIYSNPLGYVNEFESVASRNLYAKDIALFFSGNLNANRYDLYRMFFYRKYPALKFLKVIPCLVPGLFFFKLNYFNLSSVVDKAIVFFAKGFKNGLSYSRYMNYLQRSKFVICPTGFQSNETFRHIEALACGCIIISGPMPNVSIYEGNPFIIYQSISDLKNILERIKLRAFDEIELTMKCHSYFIERLSVNAFASRVGEICLVDLEN